MTPYPDLRVHTHSCICIGRMGGRAGNKSHGTSGGGALEYRRHFNDGYADVYVYV